jgi:polysaccharide biosynthesis transport protein
MSDQTLQRAEAVIGPGGPMLPNEAMARLEPLSVPFGRLSSILRRRLLVVLLCPVLIVGGTAAVLKNMPKQFTAETSIVIEPQRTQVSDLQAISPDPGDTASLVRTQIDILRSPALMLQVVRTLHLTQVPEFAPQGGGLKAAAQKLIQRFTQQPAAPVPAPTPEQMVERVAAILGGKVSFTNETRSSVLRIGVTTQAAKLSAEIANQVAQEFLDFKRQEKFTAMQRAHDWFKEQMGTLAEQLRADDLAVERYRQQYRLDEQPPDDGNTTRTATINRQQLDAISSHLADVSRERARKEGELAQAQAVIHGEAVGGALPEVLASPVINQLLAQTAVAAGREAELASAQGEGNPDLIAARAQLHRLQMRTEQEMSNVANSLNAELKATRAQEQSLREQMERLRVAVSGENAAQVALQALQTKARATRSIYESFLVRATQLANVAGIQEPDASLVSSASPPLGPSGPQIGRMVVVAGALSLVLGVGLACAIERLGGGFSLPEQLEVTLGLPLLALLPRVSRKVLRERRSSRAGVAFTASLDNLRGQMRTLGEARPKLIMVTSALPQEGKSVFAARLARNAAAAGWRVMLIECDFRRPSLAGQFGLPPAAGLCEILAGDILGDGGDVVREVAPRLHVIASGIARSDPQEMLASNRMAALLAAARARYDLVVLDTPPVLPVADALVLAPQVDTTLMVVRWEKTPRPAVQDALRRLRGSRARIMGTVMTLVDLRTAAGAGGRMSYAFSYDDSYQIRPRRADMSGADSGRNADQPFRQREDASGLLHLRHGQR